MGFRLLYARWSAAASLAVFPLPSLKPFYSRFVLLSVPGSSCFPLRRRHPSLRRLSRGNALVIRIESALTFGIEPFGRKERALRDRWAILGLEESKESLDREAKHRARLYCAYIAPEITKTNLSKQTRRGSDDASSECKRDSCSYHHFPSRLYPA